jgi:hypothetical protein
LNILRRESLRDVAQRALDMEYTAVFITARGHTKNVCKTAQRLEVRSRQYKIQNKTMQDNTKTQEQIKHKTR